MTPWKDHALPIPWPLKLLHGDNATPRDLAWVYLGALAFTLAFFVAFRQTVIALDPLKIAVLAVVTLDLAGGALANLTPGTRGYWRSRPEALRLVFLAVHAVHAAAIAFVLPGSSAAALLAWGWVMGAGAVLVLFRGAAQGDAPAMALALSGAAAVQLAPGLSPAGALLLAVFLVKLVFSFGARPAES